MAVHIDLALSNIARQVGDGMRHVVVWHGQNGNLCDRTIAALDTTCTLVDRRQVRVHVTWITATAWHFLTRSRHLTERIRIRRHVCHHNKDMLLKLIRKVFGRRERKTWRNNTLDGRVIC